LIVIQLDPGGNQTPVELPKKGHTGMLYTPNRIFR